MEDITQSSSQSHLLHLLRSFAFVSIPLAQ